jgi:hypothetical protein
VRGHQLRGRHGKTERRAKAARGNRSGEESGGAGVKWPEHLDWTVHRLCLDGEGNYIRAPSEILYEWTLDDVMDAHDGLDYVAEQKRRLRASQN